MEASDLTNGIFQLRRTLNPTHTHTHTHTHHTHTPSLLLLIILFMSALWSPGARHQSN